jgi:hypothetical protein
VGAGSPNDSTTSEASVRTASEGAADHADLMVFVRIFPEIS